MPDLDDLVLPEMEFEDNNMTRMYGAQRTASMALKGSVEAMQNVQKDLAKTIEKVVKDNYQEHVLIRDDIKDADSKAEAAKEEATRARITMDRARWYLRGIYGMGAAVIALLVFLPKKALAVIVNAFGG